MSDITSDTYDMTNDGELLSDGNDLVLRFERNLRCPIEQVWRAISEPTGLEAWFPAAVELELRVGGGVTFVNDPSFDVDPELLAFSGEVRELDAPRRFAFTWGNDLLRFELSPTDDGCRLVFTHRLTHRAMVNRTVAGWSVCLDSLSASLNGNDDHVPGWRSYYDHYVEVFGNEGAVERDAGSTIVRFERLMPVSADQVRSTLDAAQWRPEADPGGTVKWQLIPMGDTSLLLLTHTVDGEVDEALLVASWERVLAALSAELS
jgi:uncharacterized protein YndB with AHSA1/START domain